MKRVLIVQARMTSTRLPGKVLMDLCGRPMLAQELRRLKLCKRADEIVVAATTNKTDDPIQALAEKEGVRWFRGSKTDVLSRYVGAARETKADLVTRVTSDCPLIDPEVTDLVMAALEADPTADYASNVSPRTYPRGLDAEVLTRDALERADQEASSAPAREHVTYHIHTEHPERFKIISVADAQDNSDLRWTVDTAEDFELARRLYAELDLNRQTLPYRKILEYARAHPALTAINAHVPQKKT